MRISDAGQKCRSTQALHINTDLRAHIITWHLLGTVCYAPGFEECKTKMTNGHVQPFITWEIFLVCFLSSFSSLLICLLWNSWRLGHSWISSISCLTFSPAPSNAFFPLGSMPRQRHRPPLPHPQMSRNEICRSKNIHPLYPNNSKKEGGGGMLFLDQEWQAFFPWAIPPVSENRESLRLMSNLARTGNACNLCQSVSHALQFRSKYFSVTLHIYQHTWICR